MHFTTILYAKFWRRNNELLESFSHHDKINKIELVWTWAALLCFCTNKAMRGRIVIQFVYHIFSIYLPRPTLSILLKWLIIAKKCHFRISRLFLESFECFVSSDRKSSSFSCSDMSFNVLIHLDEEAFHNVPSVETL